jgi:hypothetical protein
MSSSPKHDLRLDWCSHEAAKYAVEHWHYSHTMPQGKNVYIGVWEDEKYIGAVIFGTGAGAVTDGRSYGLASMRMAELVRVALNNHTASVSKIISIAIKLLRRNSPELRMLISFADPFNGHHGGIYQAGGWIFAGLSAPSVVYDVDGKIIHSRSFNGGKWMGAPKPIPAHAKKIKVPGKYRYLYPLDAAMRAQIAPLAKPYPKRGPGETDNAAQSNAQTGGASPTGPLLES